jgi:hypothetical protein
MKVSIEVKYAGKIRDIDNRDDLQLVENSQDVNVIKLDFPSDDVNDFDGFFIDVSSGDYGDVFGFYGCVPDLTKSIYSIKRVYTE